MYPFVFSSGDSAVLLLRLVVGIILVVHGWPKIADLKKTGMQFQGMGFKPGMFWGTVAALVEFFGGLCFILGLLMGLVGFLVAMEFAVIIIWKVSKNMPFVGGWELDLLMFAGSAMLMSTGAAHLGYYPTMMGYFH